MINLLTELRIRGNNFKEGLRKDVPALDKKRISAEMEGIKRIKRRIIAVCGGYGCGVAEKLFLVKYQVCFVVFSPLLSAFLLRVKGTQPAGCGPVNQLRVRMFHENSLQQTY